ncbi:dharma [Brachyistius frenatus]|uniref:dharma n=1 Tax=Brachyistius frenatus TaxID=100188 RepID=UPI0037E95E28
MMDSRVPDFSIERILSPQLGHKPQEFLRGIPAGSGLNLRPPAPIPIPVPIHAQPLAGYVGYHQAGEPAQLQPRQKARMRTVFTDSQTKKLEGLFELTDYPPVEARAEVARSTGLSEEIIRVWFKNHRARKKQQHGGSKVKSPSPPRRK